MVSYNILDCTLRDGGYYNLWDFDFDLVQEYLCSMEAASVDFVELGLRSLKKDEFKGAFAFTTDNFVRSLNISYKFKLGVMVNASELINYGQGLIPALEKLFSPANESPISLVRIASHVHEFERALPAANWLKEQGYLVGFNLMQIAERSNAEIREIASLANRYPLDVLYFADSMGGLNPEETSNIIRTFRDMWKGPLGIHTHDNLGFALANSICALNEGVTWIDSTVTGMGRGPGNAKTEYLIVETQSKRTQEFNLIPLIKLVQKKFKYMQQEYGWGTNTFYYLAGKYSIHPTYIQEMLNDKRYDEEDILAVIEYLRGENGKQFSINTLEASRNFYSDTASGSWNPAKLISGKEVLIIGAGPGVAKHRKAIERYIKLEKPYVIALNTQSKIESDLIDIHVACHPIRLFADSEFYRNSSKSLVAPISMLSNNLVHQLLGLNIYDYGISVQENTFKFNENYCVLPNSLVITYALAIATSGKACKILLAGFDGYGITDSRTSETDLTLNKFINLEGTPPVMAVTPTQYKISSTSIYAY